MHCSAIPRLIPNSTSSTESFIFISLALSLPLIIIRNQLNGSGSTIWIRFKQLEDINFYQIFWRLMWKSIGSMHSGDDKSMRSNRSREELPFEPFRQGHARRSNLSPDPNRSFCFDYFERKKQDSRNITYNSRVKSEHKSGSGRREDMFTSMRNVLSKEDPTSKLESNQLKNPEEGRSEMAVKQALARVKNLKREQGKLKTTVQNEFNAIKNYFYQLQEMVHAVESPAEPSGKAKSASQFDPEIAREILQQAMGVQRFFQEMERKKAGIMQRLSLQE